MLPLAIVAVAVIAWLFFRDSNSRQRNRVEMDRIQRILISNERVLSLLKDIETGQRGYLLTADRNYLEPYRSAKANLPEAINDLDALVRRPDQRVDKLRALSADKMAEVEATLLVREQLGEAAALEIVRSNRGKDTMGELRQLSGSIGDTAHESLRTVSQELEDETVRSWNGILAACLILASLLGVSLFLIQRVSQRREDLIDRLEDARLRALTTLSSIGDGVITADPVGLVTYLNPVATELTGWTREDAVGKVIEQVFPLESELSGSVLENPVRRVLRDFTQAGMENPAFLVRRSGSRMIVDDSAAPIFDHENHLAGVIMVFRDMTQRKIESDALRRWQHVFEHAGFGMAILRPGEQPIVEQLNPAFAKMHGYSAEELKGGFLMRLVIPDSWDMEAKAFEAEKHSITESIHVRKDGSSFPVLVDVSVIRDEAGKAIYFTAYYSDITERKRTEEDLRRSEELYRVTADSLSQLVWTSKPDGTTEFMNARWQEKTGLSASGTGDHAWSHFLHPDDRERCLGAWEKSLGSGEIFTVDCRLQISKESGPRWHSCRAFPVRDKEGRILRWFGSCTDEHERREAADSLRAGKEEVEKANRALRRSNQDLEQFAYVASHDLQEPLRMVAIYTQLLNQEFGDKLDGQAKEYMNFAINGAQRMEALLKGLLTYSRASSEEENLAIMSDSEKALKIALTNLKVSIDEAGADISHGPLPLAKMAEIHLVQVFQNLLSNALKYRKRDLPPVIRVEADQREGMWVFLVRDNGIGIAQEYQEQIFRIFGRLHDQTQSGTGIGLALCKKLIERNGGGLWVESHPGQGSTFFFSVPV